MFGYVICILFGFVVWSFAILFTDFYQQNAIEFSNNVNQKQSRFHSNWISQKLILVIILFFSVSRSLLEALRKFGCENPLQAARIFMSVLVKIDACLELEAHLTDIYGPHVLNPALVQVETNVSTVLVNDSVALQEFESEQPQSFQSKCNKSDESNPTTPGILTEANVTAANLTIEDLSRSNSSVGVKRRKFWSVLI